MTRVALFGDPTKGLGSIATPSATASSPRSTWPRSGLPVEWFAVSSGARIAMDSGTENMDWVAAVLRRIIEFTQAGGEINVVVAGINVGAQPYWNAEATMLMHTKGILVMTPDSAMVLTGKQALDYSGGVSAEDNFGIGGYDRVMGPNGQAQYWAPDLAGASTAVRPLRAQLRRPGERFPRPLPPPTRATGTCAATPTRSTGIDFTTVGEVFSDERPTRAQEALRHPHGAARRRRPGPRAARTLGGHGRCRGGGRLDAHLGGHPVTLLGIESRPLPRRGPLPADGPEQWTAGTLFPRASKKVARAINAASGNRPVVVLANLSGFDGSPGVAAGAAARVRRGDRPGHRQLRRSRSCSASSPATTAARSWCSPRRSTTTWRSPPSRAAHASVIGGPPAAAVVFAGEVNRRTDADPRRGDAAGQGALRAELARLAPRSAPRSSGRSPQAFDRSTRSSGRCRSARWTTSWRRGSCGRTSTRWSRERGMERRPAGSS
jgi:hypothetical protein